MAFLDGPDVEVLNPGNDERELMLAWMGGACDVGAELQIANDPHVMRLSQDPRESCDAVGMGKAVVLVFSTPLRADLVRVDFQRFRPDGVEEVP